LNLQRGEGRIRVQPVDRGATALQPFKIMVKRLKRIIRKQPSSNTKIEGRGHRGLKKLERNGKQKKKLPKSQQGETKKEKKI